MAEKNRVLQEAQQIGQHFQFWTKGGDIRQLIGYLLVITDGQNEIKYTLEIEFPERFPEVGPIFQGDANIKTAIKKGLGDYTKMWKGPSDNSLYYVFLIANDLRKALNQTLLKMPENLVRKESSKNEDPSQSPEELSSAEELNSEEVEGFSEWTGEGMEASEGEAGPASFAEGSAEGDWITPDANETYAAASEYDESLTQQSMAIAQEFDYEYGPSGSVGDVNVFLPITFENIIKININFSEWPNPPIISAPEQFRDLIGEPRVTLESMKNWDIYNPGSIVTVIRELESRLMILQTYDPEIKMITGEYQARIAPDYSKIDIYLVTYGFQEFLITLDISTYPDKPRVEFSNELLSLVPQSELDNAPSLLGWTMEVSHCVDVVRDIQWLVDKHSRRKFEIALLQGAVKEFVWDEAGSLAKIKLIGTHEGEDLTFEFGIKLPSDYPGTRPEVTLLTEVEEEHLEAKKKIESAIQSLFENWSPFSYIIDLVNSINKAVFALTTITCIICHKGSCPGCQQPIQLMPDSPPETQTCQTQCPSCERNYHKHCWEQTIASFGKCGFCLRPPPGGGGVTPRPRPVSASSGPSV